jgi:hypothetical protein
MCKKMVLTLESFSPRSGMLDSLCAYWDLHHYIGDGCYETCQEILDKVKKIDDPQLTAAMNAPDATVMQPFGSVPIISSDICCEKPIKE